MGRIIFHHLFEREALTGGIKTIYYHAAFLNEMGIEAYIYAPAGCASWVNDERFSRWVKTEITVYQEDVLVFPETLQPSIVQAIEKTYPCRKIMFCQGAYLLLGFYDYTARLKEWGITEIAVNSLHGKNLLENVLGEHCPPLSLISPMIDKGLFYPEPKRKIIVCFGKKWRDFSSYEVLIQRMFHVKYPEYASIPWVGLENMTPEQLAAVMRQSLICLSLSRLEGLGLTALEAMASGNVIVGFHGGGGLDYATEKNGFWHSPEDFEGMVDSLAYALRGYCEADDSILSKVRNGSETAERYSIDNVKKQLFEFYSRLI